jgi:ribosomal protein S18 acetylase RimI-like enzyme
MASIETASSSDGPSILYITEQAGVFTPVEVSCVEELWNDYLVNAEASEYHFLVHRENDGAVLGFACFGYHSLTLGIYDLYWIAIDPAARGRGIGHALIARVEDEVRKRGGRMLLVETSQTASYTPARDLYGSSGYHIEARIRDFYAPDDDLVIFAKTLDPHLVPQT